jgi:hypothetical protein
MEQQDHHCRHHVRRVDTHEVLGSCVHDDEATAIEASNWQTLLVYIHRDVVNSAEKKNCRNDGSLLLATSLVVVHVNGGLDNIHLEKICDVLAVKALLSVQKTVLMEAEASVDALLVRATLGTLQEVLDSHDNVGSAGGGSHILPKEVEDDGAPRVHMMETMNGDEEKHQVRTVTVVAVHEDESQKNDFFRSVDGWKASRTEKMMDVEADGMMDDENREGDTMTHDCQDTTVRLLPMP